MATEQSKAAMFTAAELRERGFAMRSAPLAIMAYDPAGDGKDHDGLVILSREEHRRGELYDPDLSVEMLYRIIFCEYMPREMEFQQKAARILGLHRAMLSWTNRRKMAGHSILIETNGIGWAMKSYLTDKLGPRVRGYSTVASISGRTHVSGKLSMPRLQALGHLRMQLDLQRLKAAPVAKGVDLLVRELNSFVWASPGRPEAIEGQHDDLVMPCAAACWFGSNVIPPVTKATSVTTKGLHDKTNSNPRVRLQ